MLSRLVRALPVLVLAGCTAVAPSGDIVQARLRYLAAKASCDKDYPNSLARQADCRTDAANTYIRPYYRYCDLMTFAQVQRKALAIRADRHEISRAAYDREIAKSERMISQEEDRRNRVMHTTSSYQDTPAVRPPQ